MFGWILVILALWLIFGLIVFTHLDVTHNEDTKLKRLIALSALSGGPFLAVIILAIAASDQYKEGNISKKVNDWLEGR